MVITRIRPFSVAKIAAILYTLAGLVIGAFFSLMSMATAFGRGPGPGLDFPEALIGVAAVIVLPMLYGTMGFVGTLIAAALYNVVAGAVGGVEIEVR